MIIAAVLKYYPLAVRSELYFLFSLSHSLYSSVDSRAQHGATTRILHVFIVEREFEG